MFTGIITSIGKIHSLARNEGAMVAEISTSLPVESWNIGCSVACAGVCLTVVRTQRAEGRAHEKSGNALCPLPSALFEVHISPETLRCTNLGQWREGTEINLEPALRLGDELGGHLVSGHVDGAGTVKTLRNLGSHTEITLAAPPALLPFIAQKGSITVDGVSLTVNSVQGDDFTVNLIPHTLHATTLKHLQQDSAVNLEIDMLARYAARLREFA